MSAKITPYHVSHPVTSIKIAQRLIDTDTPLGWLAANLAYKDLRAEAGRPFDEATYRPALPKLRWKRIKRLYAALQADPAAKPYKLRPKTFYAASEHRLHRFASTKARRDFIASHKTIREVSWAFTRTKEGRLMKIINHGISRKDSRFLPWKQLK